MGIYLSTPKTEKISEDGENEILRYGLSSMQGWRSAMEDAHAAHPNLDSSTSFFGVYDGHGGKAVAKFCAKYLHQEFLKHDAYSVGELGTSIKKAFLRMDEMMCGQSARKELAIMGGNIDVKEDQIWPSESDITTGESDDELSQEELHHEYTGPTFGSTACVAIIRKNQLIVANAGDSRCIISRNGQAYDLSEDHKPDLKAEKERILNAGGFVQHGRVNGTLNLARAIGDMELKKNESMPPEMQILTANPDVNFVELGNDADFLVLACDGIWDCMSSQQLVDFIKEQLKAGMKLSMVCEKVLDKCLAPASGQEGCDNMTMILVQFKKSSQSDSSMKNQTLPSAQKPMEPDPKSQNTAETESETQSRQNLN